MYIHSWLLLFFWRGIRYSYSYKNLFIFKYFLFCSTAYLHSKPEEIDHTYNFKGNKKDGKEGISFRSSGVKSANPFIEGCITN